MTEAAGGAPTGETPTVTVTEGEKKKKRGRPYWLLLPIEGSTTFDVHRVMGKPAVLKLLKKLEIDATDPRVSNMKLLRADEVPLKLESQTIFKFAKADGDEKIDEDDEVI